jgi:hypothetical protein
MERGHSYSRGVEAREVEKGKGRASHSEGGGVSLAVPREMELRGIGHADTREGEGRIGGQATMRNNALGGSVDSASTVSESGTVAYRGGGHDAGDTSPAVPTYEGRIDGRGEGTWDGTGRPTLQTNSSSRLYPILRTEDGTNSVIGDRSTWHSESRESVSTSDLNRESRIEVDDAPLQDYDALPDLADDLSIRESPDRPPPSTPPPRKNPIVRIGAPSPRLSDFFEPQDSTTWDETHRNDAGHSFASPPSFPWTPPSASGSRLGSTTSSPRTPGADAPSPTGRAKSHALATNFSRPFSAVGSLRSNSYDSLDGQSARSVESTPSFSPYVDVNASPSPSTLSDYEVIAASTVSNAYEQPGIDSFYEAAFPSSTPTSIPTSPPTPEVTTTPSSPKRNTLKKRASALPASSPSPKPDKGTGGWSSLFRSRSKRTSQDESNVVGNGTALTSDAPGITLTDDLAPVDLSAIPSTRTSDREQQQREWERANLKPSVAKTVASGYVHNGSPSAPLPGWPGSRGLEALGVVDGRSPVVMTRRSVSDVGPARLEVLGRQSRSNSVYSDYSVYSLPPSADPSPRIDADFESQQLQGMAAGGSSTALNKARAGLKKSQPLLRTKSGKLNTPRIDPQSPDDYLRTSPFLLLERY